MGGNFTVRGAGKIKSTKIFSDFIRYAYVAEWVLAHWRWSCRSFVQVHFLDPISGPDDVQEVMLAYCLVSNTKNPRTTDKRGHCLYPRERWRRDLIFCSV